jgi:hypothetical protein
MDKAPELPLEKEAAVERCQQHTQRHAEGTWKLLFPPERLSPLSASDHEETPPRASILLELQQYSSALFDCEAQQYESLASNEVILRSWLRAIAEKIQKDTIKKTQARFENVRSTMAERKTIVNAGLSRRIDHWITAYRVRKNKPLISRAPPPPDELGGGMRFSLPGQKAFDTAKPSEHSEVSVTTISARLDQAADQEGISHEEMAHRIGVSRTTYFEVKAGRGGKKARRKVELYLSGSPSGSS